MTDPTAAPPRTADDEREAIDYHRRALAAAEAAYGERPLYFRRSDLRDVATYQANRAAIATALREGRVLADGAPIPDDGRPFEAEPRSERIYTRSELRDAAFYTANQADIVAAQREGRIRDDTDQGVRKRGTP